MLILGGIGSGKTTCAVHPLLAQLLEQECGGLIFNIKGDFNHAVTTLANTTQSQSRLSVFGVQQQTMNLIEGLTPETAASFLKSAFLLNGSPRMDGFWVDTATELCRNALGVLSFTPKHYTLAGLYEYLFNEQYRTRINDEIDVASSMLEDGKIRLLNTYRHYQDKIFATFDDKVQSGVKATVAQVLSPFTHPELADAFCATSLLRMESVLEGAVYLVDLPLSRWGLGGKVAYSFIKLRFFNVMQQRATRSEWNQDRPVFFLCDEYQDIISASKDGLSDLNFWDKSRSSNTIGIISAQSISSFYATIGDRDLANAILQNFRQKICFRTEDQATLDFLNRVTGHVEVEKRTISKQKGKSFSEINKTNSHRSTSESITFVDKVVLDPQLMRTLKPAHAIALLVLSGHGCDDVLEMMPIYF